MLNILCLVTLVCGTSQGVEPFLALFPPSSPLSEGLPKSFAACLAELGQDGFCRPSGSECFEEQLAGGPRSWHAAPFARSLSRSLPKFYSSMLAQGLGRHSSKAGGVGSGKGRRRRMHKEEEETLHHCKGFEFRKKSYIT